ncbi:MAG: phosphate ABC transporter permease subunit PstC, partial [Pseudomonadota bacterium]
MTSASTLLLILALLGLGGFYAGRGRAARLASAGDGARGGLHSLPNYYGYYAALFTLGPALLLYAVWLIAGGALADWFAAASAGGDIGDGKERAQFLSAARGLAQGTGLAAQPSSPALQAAAEAYRTFNAYGALIAGALILGAAAVGLALARARIHAGLRARNIVERAVTILLVVCSSIAILTTLGIVLSLFFEASRFFARVPATDFLFGLNWSPQTALREDQVGQSGSFGAVPLFAGALMITVIALLVATPVGLFSAIYLAEYASPRARRLAKPVVEILAGVPTVVYGFFALLTVGPFIREAAAGIGLDVATQSALAAGLVMGIMIVPFISSLADDVITAVPQALRDGSYAIGATKSETIRLVIAPAALPGIVGALLLAASRAIGETMIVVMAAGKRGQLTANPLEDVTTITVQIVTLLTGDQEFDSAKTLSAFALGLVL